VTERIITFSDGWITTATFEHDIQHLSRMPLPQVAKIIFFFPKSCKVMVDAAVRLLSLANQLATKGREVVFIFDGEHHEAMSYLNRANFFTCLSSQVQVRPERPDSTYAKFYQGNSKNLVEFKSISPDDSDASSSIPTQLIKALGAATAARADCHQLCQTAFTLFGELIDNIYSHSQTELDGFAAFQVYRQGKRAQVAVSDSGIGLLETFRPKLLWHIWVCIEAHRSVVRTEVQAPLLAWQSSVGRSTSSMHCISLNTYVPATAHSAVTWIADVSTALPGQCSVADP
jgi:hypothetical protein